MKLRPLRLAQWEADVPPRRDDPEADRVDLVLIGYEPDEEVGRWCLDLLSAEESEAVRRYRSPELRERAAASRAALRLLLSLYTNIPAPDLRISADALGKPCVAARPQGSDAIAFNLAHSGDLVLYAFSRRQVGVDIEQIRPLRDAAHFAGTFLGESERKVHAALPEEERLDYAYRAWVCKEALAKLTGHGLSMDFTGVDVLRPALVEAGDLRHEGASLELFSPVEGYVAALAACARPDSLRFFRPSRLQDLFCATMVES